MRRAIRLLDRGALGARMIEGGLKIPTMATLHSSHSLTWPLDASSERCHALGCRVISSLKIIHFSSFRMAPGEPSRRRASTWQRQVQSKAALRANGFACNTNQRGFRTGSIGREEPVGLASLDSDGPASQSRRQGHPANASVQTRNCSKRRTAISNQAHPMPHGLDEQGPRRNS